MVSEKDLEEGKKKLEEKKAMKVEELAKEGCAGNTFESRSREMVV